MKWRPEGANRRILLIAGVVIIGIFLVTALAGALMKGTADTEEASTETPPEEFEETALPEATTAPSPPPPPPKQKKAPPPPPQSQTPEEKINAAVGALFFKFETDESGTREVPDTSRFRVHTQRDANNCLYVRVNFRSRGAMPWESTADALETEMGDTYRAIYKDPETRSQVGLARVAVYGKTRDSYGQEHQEKLMVTSISGDTADKVNWSETASVDWPNVWTTEYTAPEIQVEEAKNAVERAIDCATDSGFGDLDWLQCP